MNCTRWIFGSLLILGMFSYSFGQKEDGKSLIAFSDDEKVWMSAEDALVLEVTSDNFMDITDHQEDPSPKQFNVGPIPTKISHQQEVEELIQELESSNLAETITSLSSLYNRYYNSDDGEQAAAFLFQQFVEFSAARSDITVQYFPHSWKMPSVIARIQGADDDKAGTRVIIGAHEDCISTSSTAKSPGADDDASGTSTVLEVFRVLAQSQYKPNRTVEFHAYSAEEGGLKGSQAIAAEYSSLDIIVEGMLQFDMDMYGQPNEPIGIITDYTNPQVSEFLRLLVDTYSDLSWGNTKCGYGCSDHASWTKYGYRSGFPFETAFGDSNPYIHTVNDVLSKISVTRGVEFAKVAIGFIVEMSA